MGIASPEATDDWFCATTWSSGDAFTVTGLGPEGGFSPAGLSPDGGLGPDGGFGEGPVKTCALEESGVLAEAGRGEVFTCTGDVTGTGLSTG